MVHLEGDIHYKYLDGDCVWAKYMDYPWWPGQIQINNNNSSSYRRRKNNKKSTITVKWFGEFGIKSNECKLSNVLLWNPDEADRVYIEIDDADLDEVQNAMDSANTVYFVFFHFF